MVTLQYSVLQRKMFYAIGKIVHLTVTELRMFSACVTILNASAATLVSRGTKYCLHLPFPF